ncbi:MAG: bifunctional (p)ppGpp synthetase/guanosine-3',5'-bis(diphosphate) 3'-pyrophosphohydrolase [Parcubacteria group bacterium]|nr:bifunctional (p)ppGpp synthetase/guanosine-3',5'-bis(diphosphate) 3'-pyrophosphohydrolase [Parcubacteria group bacterium]
MSIESILKNREGQEKALIQRAYDLADQAHKEQTRSSGEPYIIHPVAVAKFLADLNLDAKTISAALLHDVLEDTSVSREQLEKEFGQEIAFLVDGVTKLEQIQFKQKSSADWATLRKMLFAMTKDIRVILIKLADRWHNLSTIKYLPVDRQQSYATESIEIFAPIAERLGMGEIKGQIEDMAFPFAYYKEYWKLIATVQSSYQERIQYLEKIKPKLLRYLAEQNIKVLELNTRAKHYYSLWKKLKKTDGDLSRVYDLAAIRLIVNDVAQCYEVLGAIHKLWRPLPGRIKDYIAIPKPNGYRSLHTTVFGENGHIIEVQIKTLDMHHHAELGIAAHWAYSEAGKPRTVMASIKDLEWINKLREWKKTLAKPDEFLESIKLELFKDRIFVFTPRGEVKELPEGATPIDFAYRIHGDLGNACTGAKVDGKLVPLNYQLKNGQIIEILKAKNPKPSLDWLSFVKTDEAQRRIRSWFRNLNYDIHIRQGKDSLENETKMMFGKNFAELIKNKGTELLNQFSVKSENDLYAMVGRGDITPWQVIKRAVSETGLKMPTASKETKKPKTNFLPIKTIGIKQIGILTKMAKCCLPKEKDTIVGYLTLGKGISIHKKNCASLVNSKKERVIPVAWSNLSNEKNEETTYLNIKVRDRVGLLKDISETVANLGINIKNIKTKNTGNTTTIVLSFGTGDLEKLNSLLTQIKSIPNVVEVKKA